MWLSHGLGSPCAICACSYWSAYILCVWLGVCMRVCTSVGDGEPASISKPLDGAVIPECAGVSLLLWGSERPIPHPPPTASGVGASRLALKPQPAPGLSGNSVLPVGGGQVGGGAGTEASCPPGPQTALSSRAWTPRPPHLTSCGRHMLCLGQTCLSHARMESTDRPLFKRDRQTDSGAPPLGCGQAPPNA